MARGRRPSQTLRLSLLLSSIRSCSLVSFVSLSWSENIVTVSFSGGSRSMFSICENQLRFTVIFIAPVRALIVSHAVDGSPLRPSLKVSRDDVVKPFGSLSTGFVIFWGGGVGKALTFEVVTSQNPRSMKHRSDLLPSPLVMVSACLLFHRGGDMLRRASPRRLRLISKDWRSAPTLTPSSVPLNRRCSLSGDLSSCQRQRNSIAQACEMGLFACRLGLLSLLNFIQSHIIVSKPICLWGRLVYLASLLKNSDGFIGLFTETNMLTMSYLSFLKRILVVFLPVGSLGSFSYSSPYSSPSSSSSPAFSRRSVSPSAHVRRCISKSITVLLSCGAVRSGPEMQWNSFRRYSEVRIGYQRHFSM
ncbi:hypothetical protein HID58_058271 [Brassica napus]|uniref:Secreted protein n=1 Tax=Brassica napus TaxID=3708 RepID=A0ABQ7ZQB5_BRANA|nr:hypothetical protein HID58_058271 [Brassica napus]